MPTLTEDKNQFAFSYLRALYHEFLYGFSFRRRKELLLAGLLLFIQGFAYSQNHLPYILKKYAPEELRQDFQLMREVLEKAHPSLYLYTPKLEMNHYFDQVYNNITDSMNEIQFRNLLSFVISKIRCGHTAVKPSNSFKRMHPVPFPQFPLYSRVWGDTMVVYHNTSRKDSFITRGTIIKAIDGMPVKQIIQSLYQFMPTDGYSMGVNEIRLTYNFPAYYRNIFGISEKYSIRYLSEEGEVRDTVISAYFPLADTMDKKKKLPDGVRVKKKKKLTRKDKLASARDMDIDTSLNLAVIRLNTFSNGFKLKKFYRQSFRRIAKEGIDNVVIDLRDNGGGNIRNYILLAKYLADSSFRVADTVTSIVRSLPYSKHIHSGRLNDIYMIISTRKKKDGQFHFTYFEDRWFKPKKKNHFGKNIYAVSSGQTFSAAVLFITTLKNQDNFTLVGEETGGTAYGNNGMLIPDLILPKTKVRISLPLFRMIINPKDGKSGRGIFPDIEVKPTVESIRSGEDLKIKKVLDLIQSGNNQAGGQ
ncbi:MAG TPA: S41 family peptidase [Parasegetibacter sp.]